MLRYGYALCTVLLLADKPEPNPLFRELREVGVAVGAQSKVALPAPRMADGLDAAGQKTVLAAIIGEDYSLQDFLRQSVTNPFVMKRRDHQPPDAHSRAIGVDVWFVAHGDFRAITGKQFLERLMQSGGKERKVHVLTEAELAKRNLQARSDKGLEERWGHGTATLLNEVQITVTNHSVVTRGPESVLVASRIDPRFNKDEQFPNHWQAIRKDEEGNAKLGPRHSYVEAGSYFKIVKLDSGLAGRDDALFVEYHLVFLEPIDWFRGTNNLKSKLGTVVQDQVRTFRKELLKANPRE